MEKDCERPAERKRFGPQCRRCYDRSLSSQPQCRAKGCRARLDIIGRNTRRGFCRKHEDRVLTNETLQNAMVRMVQKVDVDWRTTCWIWRGKTEGAYGVVKAGTDRKSLGGNGNALQWRVHRLTYLWLWGPHGHRQTVDHVCNVSLCINPLHLEAVSVTRNNKMKTFRERHPDRQWWEWIDEQILPFKMLTFATIHELPTRPMDTERWEKPPIR